MRLVLSGGGTGGHIYPALAVYREMKRRHPDLQVLYIGTPNGLESRIVTEAKLPFATVEVQGLKRKRPWQNVKTLRLFWRATREARKILQHFAPDLVLGTGGYVCGPVLYAAQRLKIPVAIHEQNAIPGLTNRFLSRYATLVATSFPGTEKFFPRSHVVLTGNPRASEVAQANRVHGWESLKLPLNTPLVLFVGGSRGSETLNGVFTQVLTELHRFSPFHFVYVTGECHYPAIQEELQKRQKNLAGITVVPFLYNLPEVLAACQLVVSRAGASFLAEVAALSLPSILIPSPYVANNHQEANALQFAEGGAARILRESELSVERLLRELAIVLTDETCRRKMRAAAGNLGNPQAAGLLCDELTKATAEK